MSKYSIPHSQHRQVQDLLKKVREMIYTDIVYQMEHPDDDYSTLYDEYRIEIREDDTVYDAVDDVVYPTLVLWAEATIAAESFDEEYDPGLTKFVGE